MSNYKHGIRTSRRPTQLAVPITSDGCLQCVIGTAPVNLAADPYDTVNKPFVFHNKAAAIAGLGYCTDFKIIPFASPCMRLSMCSAWRR